MFKKSSRLLRLTFFLLFLILFCYGVIQAKDFLYPIAFGILLAYLLYPVSNFLEKKNFPRILAILLSMIIGATIVAIAVVFILNRIGIFIDYLPVIRGKALSSIQQLEEFFKLTFGISDYRIDAFIQNRLNDLNKLYNNMFTATTGTIFKIGIQPIYIFLFLYYRTKLAYFILMLVGYENRLTAVKVLREISVVVTRYMLGVLTVVIILCFFNSIGLLIVGIKFPFLLGIISALFSFIPYFGNFIGGSIPFFFALLTEDTPIIALRVVIFILIVHFVENNILTPNIVGNRVRISPLIVILGLILASMVWGIPGMLVYIPFIAMLKIIFKNVPSLQPYAYLLGTRGTKRHAITVNNIKQFLSRKINEKKEQTNN